MTLDARHYLSDRYVADPTQPRHLCPVGGKLLNLDAYIAVVGCTPEEYGRRLVESPWRFPYVDPSDDPTFLQDYRGPR